MCREGPETMRLDADRALRGLGPASRWRPAALLLRGAAQVLQAEDDRAEASLADAAEAAESVGATPSRIAALAQRSLLVAARGDETCAESLAAEARALVDEHGLAGYVRSAIAFAASARFALRAADFEHARADLEKARALREQLTHALPWLSVQTSLEAARVALALGDLGEADAWLSHADEIVRRRPRLGVLPDRLNELRAEVDRMAKGRQAQASALTAAELRLLPLLVTHLSFREIGERLHVSRNTVKTQAISVYRKLGVTSRSEAVESAAELGLLDVPRGLDADFMRTG
jgi:LuxR family maltose regulon positive regulatory protein